MLFFILFLSFAQLITSFQSNVLFFQPFSSRLPQMISFSDGMNNDDLSMDHFFLLESQFSRSVNSAIHFDEDNNIDPKDDKNEDDQGRSPLPQQEIIQNIVRKMRNILLEDWNPIGEWDFPRDEYDSYLPGLFTMLLRKPTVEEIAEYLRNIEIRYFDLELSQCIDDDRPAVAQKLYDLEVPSIMYRDPEILNQLGLQLLSMDGQSSCRCFCALYCFAELNLLYPNHSDGKKNFIKALKESVNYLQRRMHCSKKLSIQDFGGFSLSLPTKQVFGYIKKSMSSLKD